MVATTTHAELSDDIFIFGDHPVAAYDFSQYETLHSNDESLSAAKTPLDDEEEEDDNEDEEDDLDEDDDLEDDEDEDEDDEGDEDLEDDDVEDDEDDDEEDDEDEESDDDPKPLKVKTRS
jgi:hypothetical protein